jgi:thymidylate synthase (FAD)
MDPRFHVKPISATFEPQRLIWMAMHQDYYEGTVADTEAPPETEAGELVVKHLLRGERGHYGPLEHPAITFAVAGFPHSVVQQARTHRVGISFDVQSMRYTGKRVAAVATDKLGVEDVFYFRSVGNYADRFGKKYAYSKKMRETDMQVAKQMSTIYGYKLQEGFAEEHARGMLPFDYRQNFVLSFNLRSAMHFLDLRSKLDAQAEIIDLCNLMVPLLQKWAPEVMNYYIEKRLGRARLSP